MSVYLRGSVYWLDFVFNGERVQCSTKQGNRQVALEIERARRSDLSRGLFKLDPPPPPPPPPRHTIQQLSELLEQRWKVEDRCSPQNLSLLKMVRADWGTTVAEDLTAVLLQRYCARRGAEEYATATTNRILQAIRRMFSLGQELIPEGKFVWPKFKLPSEKGNARQGFTKPEQMTQVLENLPDDGLREFVSWCWATGMRKSEAASLRWAWVAGKELTVPGEFTKSGEAHSIQFGGVLPAIIAKCRARRSFELNGTAAFSEFLFHRGDGQPVQEFRKSWKSACRKVGCGNLLFHDLRRSAVRDLLRAGGSQSTAMKISGHRTASVFRRYDIVDGDDQQLALDKQKVYRAR
jgi:integrase